MVKLYCAMCKTEKEEQEFTPFDRNPSLKDRNGRVGICRDCCSSYVEDRGNSKQALKEVLRLVDIPYIEKYGQSALENYEKKRKGTNVIIKRNVYDETEEVSDVENSKLQTTIYTSYCARLGVIPKNYINHSFSDGLREEKQEETPTNDKQVENDKEVQSAIKFLIKNFGEGIYEDKERLAKAIQIKIDECSLHKNNNKKRQDKYRIKKQVVTLVEADVLNAKDYSFLLDEDKESADVTVNDYEDDNQDNTIPSDIDITEMKVKWGTGYKDFEYVAFEQKYRELRRNYEIKTASHDEFLKLACVSVIRGQNAMATNDIEGAEKWLKIFQNMTSAGKLQPSQMSKADLSGGLNNFSEYYKSVEQAKGVIEILPQFKKAPRDDADFVVFCLVQYVRRLKGLNDIKYEDIWEFYEELAKSNTMSNKDGE